MSPPLLDRLSEPVVVKGLAQVGVASSLAAVVLVISYLRNLDVETELGRAFIRGFIQVLAMGAVIGVLFSLQLAWSTLVIAAMMGFAAWISKNRGAGVPSVFRVSLVSIVVGSGVVIVASCPLYQFTRRVSA